MISLQGWLVGVILRVPYMYFILRRPTIGPALLFATFLAGSFILVAGPLGRAALADDARRI